MSESNENFMVIGGKRFDLIPREGKSTRAKSFVKHNGAFFTVTPVAAGNLAVAVAASPVAAKAAIPFAADAEAGEITEADVQKFLLTAIQQIRNLSDVELQWEDIESKPIGNDLVNPPGGLAGKEIFVREIQDAFNDQLVADFPQISPFPGGFLWERSVRHPEETYRHVAHIMYLFIRPIPQAANPTP